MIVAVTGHRRDKLNIEDASWITAAIASSLKLMGATRVLQGMCDGSDLWAAVAAKSVDVPYTAVKPYAGHRDSIKNDLALYDKVWENAGKRVVLENAEKYPGPWVMHNRNRWLVDHAESVLAVWDGGRTGGTASTVNYAIVNQVPIYKIDPFQKEVGWYRKYEVLQESGVAQEKVFD